MFNLSLRQIKRLQAEDEEREKAGWDEKGNGRKRVKPRGVESKI